MKIGHRAKLAVASALTLVAAAAPLATHAEVAGGVIGCDAPGSKQVGGAVIGAVLGGIAGSNLAKHERTTGTLVGATAGAAAGSYVGCRMQKGDAASPLAGPPARPVAERYEEPGPHARPAAYYDDDAEDRDSDGRRVPPGLAKKPHQMPPGLAKKYGVGERLPASYVSEPRRYLADPRRHGLRHAPAGYRWVVVDHDAYLVQTRTGVISEIARAILG